jgi:hypothetical protein
MQAVAELPDFDSFSESSSDTIVVQTHAPSQSYLIDDDELV